MPKKSYSETDMQEAIAAVRANNGNVMRAWRELGGRFPRATIQSWVKGTRRAAEAEKAEVAGVNLGDARQVERFDRIIDAYQEHVLRPEVVAKANAVQAMTAVGIASDKKRAILGKPEHYSASFTAVTFATDPHGSKTQVRDMSTIEGEWREDGGAMVNGDNVYVPPGALAIPGGLQRLADQIIRETTGRGTESPSVAAQDD